MANALQRRYPGGSWLEWPFRRLFDDVFETWLREKLGERRPGANVADHDGEESGAAAAVPVLSAVARFVIADDKDKRKTLEDLARCATETTQPLWTTYRGHRVATNPLPGAIVGLRGDIA